MSHRHHDLLIPRTSHEVRPHSETVQASTTGVSKLALLAGTVLFGATLGITLIAETLHIVDDLDTNLEASVEEAESTDLHSEDPPPENQLSLDAAALRHPIPATAYR